jgi:translation initiation factor 2 subunit 1
MTDNQEEPVITQKEEINEISADKDEEEKVETKVAEEDSSSDEDDHIKCRFYRKELPEIGDLVIGRITQVNEAGCYLELFEYDACDAFLPFTQLTKNRIKKGSMKSYVKEGRQEIVEVIRVDEKSKSCDVSRKIVKKEDGFEALAHFINAKKVHAIMKATARLLNCSVLSLY